MRTCNWYRLVLLCLLSGVLLVLLNVLLCDAPQPEPCNCDCSEALSRRAAELKVFYEHETEKKIETLQRHVAISPNTHTVAPGVGENTEQPHHRLAVLVPFRNRHEELQEFVPHIHQFLTRQNVHHDIWVINQAGSHRYIHIYINCHCSNESTKVQTLGVFLGIDRSMSWKQRCYVSVSYVSM